MLPIQISVQNNRGWIDGITAKSVIGVGYIHHPVDLLALIANAHQRHPSLVLPGDTICRQNVEMREAENTVGIRNAGDIGR